MADIKLRPWTTSKRTTRRRSSASSDHRPKTTATPGRKSSRVTPPEDISPPRSQRSVSSTKRGNITTSSYIDSSQLLNGNAGEKSSGSLGGVSFRKVSRSETPAAGRRRRSLDRRPSKPQEVTQSWAFTELPDGDETDAERQDILRDAASSSPSVSSEDEAADAPAPEAPVAQYADIKAYEETPRWRRKNLPWAGGQDNSDDYDTDLEDDFPPEPTPLPMPAVDDDDDNDQGDEEEEKDAPVDATGQFVYEDICQKNGIVAASFLLRNLGEGNLRMRHHCLGGRATKPLAEALKVNTVCEEVDLTDNYIEGTGASALARMLQDNMFIVNLNVSNNFIRSEGAEAFASMLEANTTLKTLSLQGNKLTDEDARRISDALRNNMSLSCLDLSHNNIGETGGMYFAQGLATNIGLADLDLSWNHIREKGAVAIAKALQKNSTLEILDISWNGMALNGTLALAQALRVNKHLKVLDISNNRLNTEAGVKLALGIARNKSLETILMALNPIGEEGVHAVLKGVAKNPTAKLVGVEGCMDMSTSPTVQAQIQELENCRDIMIMYTTGSPQQSRIRNINGTVLAVFGRFLMENADRMEDLFNQMDKDKSGDVTLEELKYGLKDFGLRLTSKQLDMLLDELDADKSGTIEFTELMEGAAMVSREQKKNERQAIKLESIKDAQSVIEVAATV